MKKGLKYILISAVIIAPVICVLVLASSKDESDDPGETQGGGANLNTPSSSDAKHSRPL